MVHPHDWNLEILSSWSSKTGRQKKWWPVGEKIRQAGSQGNLGIHLAPTFSVLSSQNHIPATMGGSVLQGEKEQKSRRNSGRRFYSQQNTQAINMNAMWPPWGQAQGMFAGHLEGEEWEVNIQEECSPAKRTWRVRFQIKEEDLRVLCSGFLPWPVTGDYTKRNIGQMNMRLKGGGVIYFSDHGEHLWGNWNCESRLCCTPMSRRDIC